MLAIVEVVLVRREIYSIPSIGTRSSVVSSLTLSRMSVFPSSSDTIDVDSSTNFSVVKYSCKQRRDAYEHGQSRPPRHFEFRSQQKVGFAQPALSLGFQSGMLHTRTPHSHPLLLSHHTTPYSLMTPLTKDISRWSSDSNMINFCLDS